jgi:hypothetical protein
MPLILPGNVASATAAVGYNIDNSCRFTRGDSSYIHFTQAAPTDNLKWTCSWWMKPSFFTDTQNLITAYPSAGNIFFIHIPDANAKFRVGNYDHTGYLTTSAAFRDPSAWYHVVVVWDSANGTEGDRMIIYINGTRVTSFSEEDYPDQNQACILNADGVSMQIGRRSDGGYLDSYMAEIVFIDGLALAATSFGEFNSDSPTIWQPIDVSGLTFGNNGFWLDFEDSADLGADVSGKSNDFTSANLAAADQATDTPTNNFCTMNPLSNVGDSAAPGTTIFSQGNCELDSDPPGDALVGGTFGASSGKWYWEIQVNHASAANTYIGLRAFEENWGALLDPERGSTADNHWYDGVTLKFGNDGSGGSASGTDGRFMTYVNKTYLQTDSGSNLVDDDILGINLDLDNGDVYLQINGSDIYSGNSVAPDLRHTVGKTYTPVVKHSGAASLDYIRCNFGGCSAFALSSAVNDENGYGNFEYAPKSGHLALCTKNLGSDGG